MSKIKVLYAFSNDNAEYIIEIKRLDLGTEATLSQKYRWLFIKPQDIEPLSFVSMKEHPRQYRKFEEGELWLDSAEFISSKEGYVGIKTSFQKYDTSKCDDRILERIANFLNCR